MSVDMLSAFAQIGTFVVIAATAVAALAQLRHMRAANQVASISTFIHEYEGPEMSAAFHFVRTELVRKLEDPSFREEIRNGDVDRSLHPETAVCNFFDTWGGHYRQGVIDRRMFMRHNAGIILAFWERLKPVVALSIDPDTSTNIAFEQFEYLAVQASDWLAAHPRGDYPIGVRRMPLAHP